MSNSESVLSTKVVGKLTFEAIIEAGLTDLVDLCDPMVGGGRSQCIETFYGRAILHFLRGENEALSELLRSARGHFQDHPEIEYLEVACALREQVRKREFDRALLAKGETLALESTRWQGEILILLATVRTVLDDYGQAMNLFTRAADAFEKQGCRAKSLRARMNVIVCESNLFPDRNLFARYHDLYRRALRRESRDLIVATTCLLNISREYQRAGAYLAALKYCNRALRLFELQMGEINYYLTLAHRAHLLCELGRRAEARIDFETAKLGNFKEVEAALEAIAPMLNGEPSLARTDNPNLLPTWRERLAEGRGAREDQPKLSALEEKLIHFLAGGPRDRIDILEEIYGGNLDHETKLNRFKSLLGTLRKKFPNFVICEEGKYRLADEILIPSRARSSQTTGL